MTEPRSPLKYEASDGVLPKPAPMRFRAISREIIALNNRLAQGCSLQLSAAAGVFRIDLHAMANAPAPVPDGTWFGIRARWAGNSWNVAVPPELADRLLHPYIQTAVTPLPHNLRLAIVAAALQETMASLAATGVGEVALEEAGPISALDIAPDIIWTLQEPEASGAPVRGTLATDMAGLHTLTHLIPAVRLRRSTEWDALPFSLRLEIGRSVLSHTEWKTLRQHDVIIIARPSLSADGTLLLRPCPGLAIRARIEGDQLYVLDNPRITADMTEPDYPDAPTAQALDEIPVHLSFDLGSMTVTFTELARMAPGRIFELAIPPQRAVSIRANGVAIGEGELVEIDGLLGVCVTRVSPPGHSA